MSTEQTETSWHLIGKVHSAQGVRGQVFVLFFPETTPWIKRWKTLVLSEIEHSAAPKKEYPIRSVHRHSKQGKTGYVVTLEHVTDKDVADSLAKRFIWIPADFLVSQKTDQTIYLKEIENFTVVDKTLGELGPIIRFGSNGPQDLITVQTARGNFEVPLVKAFIVKIDFDNKILNMDIPEGLIE